MHGIIANGRDDTSMFSISHQLVVCYYLNRETLAESRRNRKLAHFRINDS